MNQENIIKLTIFYPFSNFLRVTQEFYEDKAVIKSNSLKSEYEFEFKYEDVGEISDGFLAPRDQKSFGFLIIAITGMLLYIFCTWLYENLFWLRIGQLIFIAGLILYAISFIRNWYIFIFDKNGNIQTRIKQNNQNKDLILQIIEKIKLKSSTVEELTILNPFLSNLHVFEHKYLRFSDLKNTTDRFYENEIVGIEKSIDEETLYRIKFNELNGEVFRGKTSNDLWTFVAPLMCLIYAILLGLRFGFGINFYIPVLHIFYMLMTVFVISVLLSYIKREIFGFYGKNGQIEYWAYINKNEKEKVEKIIEYVKSRIPEENKE